MELDTCDCCSKDEISPSVEAFEQTGAHGVAPNQEPKSPEGEG